MRIDTAGNVGIGTDAPAQLLSVGDSDVVSTNYIRMNQRTPTAAATYGGLEFFYDNTAGITGVNAAIRYASGAARNDGELTFYTGSSGSTSEAMRIASEGNVGIGYNSPTAKLHVLEDGSPCTLRVQALGASNTAALNLLGRDPSNGSVAYYIQTETDGALSFSKDTTERMRIDSSGNLLLGTTDIFLISNQDRGIYAEAGGSITSYSGPGTCLNLGRSNNGVMVQFWINGGNTSGGINTTQGGTPTFFASSDERLKDNIVDHESELANVMSLRPARWDWKKDEQGSGEGFIAQELEKTAWSDLVSEGEDGFKQVSGLGTVETRLIKAMQEQQVMIEALKAEVEALKNA
jgi:hypothetical protein